MRDLSDLGIKSMDGEDVRLDLLTQRGFTDVSFLRDMPNLRTLSIWEPYDGGVDVSAVEGLTTLRILWIYLHSMGDPVDLSRLTNLVRLEIAGGRKYTGYEGLTGLQCLTVLKSVWKDFASLSALESLHRLALYSTALVSVEELPELPLRRLDIRSSRRLASLEGIERFPELEVVWLAGIPRLTTIEPLTRLPRLRRLVIDSMKRLESIRPLTRMTSLRSLRCADVLPVDGALSVLRELDHVRCLHVSYGWHKGEFDMSLKDAKALNRHPKRYPDECRDLPFVK